MRRPLLFLLLLAVSVMAVSAPALATDEPEPEMVQEFEGAEPAVILDDSGGSEPEPAWTFRYLVPTFLVLTLIGIGITGYRWYQLRSRYQIEP